MFNARRMIAGITVAMPIYEYQCKACGHHLEVLQKVSDPPLKTCPKCKKRTSLTKLVSAAGFRLKGTGWYATDFKDKGKKPPEKKADGANGKSKDSTASESKGKESSSESKSKDSTAPKSTTPD